MVWAVTLGLTFMIMYAWYVTQPATVGAIDMIIETAEDNGWNNTYFNQGIGILRPIAYYWGILILLGVLAFGFISSQRQDWRGGYA